MTVGDKIRNSCNEELAEILVNLCHESYTKAIEDVSRKTGLKMSVIEVEYMNYYTTLEFLNSELSERHEDNN